MKACFVCGVDLTCQHPPIELVFRKNDAAHMDCVWHAAQLAVYGFNASIVTHIEERRKDEKDVSESEKETK